MHTVTRPSVIMFLFFSLFCAPSLQAQQINALITNTNGTETGFAVQNLGNTATSYSGMLFYDQNGVLGQFQGFNNITHEYRINNVATNGSINFMLGGASKFAVAPSGNVGIGTTSPTRAKLEVVGNVTNQPNPGNVSLLRSTGVLENIPAGTDPISIYATADIFSPVFIAFSDARIKNIEGRSDGARDLATLAAIEVTDYSYIVTKGTGKQKKVIGQQVEQVYPQAVSRSTDVVPDIYEKAQVEDGWVMLATNLTKGERVRLIGKGTEGIHEVLEVAQDSFRTDFAADGDEVFVYGREVNDFRNVDYDAIAMLNVSATQELNRRLEKQAADLVAQAEEMSKQTTRIAELEQDRQAQAARIAELEKQASEIAMLKQQMAALQAAGLTVGRLDAAQLAAAR